MADDIKLGIDVAVQTSGDELIDALSRKLNTLNRQIKAINAGISSAARGISSPGGTTSGTGTNAPKSASDALGFDRQAITALRQKLSLQGRLANQQARQEREALAGFKRRMSFQAKAEAQDVAAIRTKASEEARAFRQRMSFTSRMGKLAIAEERRVASERSRSIADAARKEAKRSRDIASSIRANARLESAENRRVDRERSSRASARSRGFSSIRQGASDVREGAGRAVRGAGAMSAVAAASTGAAIRRGVSTRMEVDTAETNLKIFSGQTAEKIKQARKGFIDNEAIENGLGIAGGLDAYSEVLKAGIKSPEQVVSTIMKGVAGLELNLRETTKLAGLIDRNYGSASDPAKIKSALNAVAVAAREDPTQSNEIVEGVKRGFGALSTGNMTPEQLTALVSGGQSVGIQPGKAGTFVGTQAKRMSEGASKFLGPKQRKELDYAARELGFGNARAMAQAYAKESYASIMSVNEKLASMAPDKRSQVADALYGTQWSDEGLQMSQGVEGVKKTYSEITDGRNANFLDEAARQRAQSLQGQWNSTRSIFGRFWDSFGAGFEDILTSINRYFLNINSRFDYDKIKSYVVSFMDGIKDALGVKTWTELLQNMFGGNLGNAGPQIREFARGLTEGVLTIVRAIRSVMTAFTGSNATAAEMGKWAGEFIALSAALLVAAPAISVMTGIGVALTGLATVALGAWRILKAAGLVGATGVGSTPKVPVAPGQGVGGLGRLLGLGGAAAGVAGSGLTKGDQDALTRKLGDWAKEREKPVTPPTTTWIDPPARTAVEKLKEAVRENTLIHRQKFEQEDGFQGLIRKASLSTSSPAQGVRATIEAMGGRISNASVGSVPSPLSGSTAGGAFGPGPLAGSTPGAALGSGGGRLSSRGIIGGVGSSPGRGVGTGSSTLPSGPIAGRMKSVYDAFRSTGLSHEASKSFAAEIGRENDFNPNLMYGTHRDPANGAVNAGMMSWQKGRATALLARLREGGHLNPDGSIKRTLEALNAQAQFAIDEMKNGTLGPKGQRALGVLNDPNATHAQRALALGDDVIKWRQHDPRYASHARKRDRYFGQMEGVSQGAQASVGLGSTSGQVLDQMRTLRRSGQVVNEQCVSLAKAAVGATGSVTTWQKGQAADLGTLKPGTPVATFLDRMGRQSARYAGGGTGTMGAGLDHAGVFQEYIRDKDGKNIGMRLAEQYNGSGGVKSKDYLFGKGFGERNGSNYSAILGPDGSPLGGARNPMSQITQQADAIKSSGWKPGAGANAGALGSDTSRTLGTDAPVRVQNTMPIGGGAGGGVGHSSTTTNTIHIQGAGQDAETIANAVQRKLNEKMMRRTNDLSPSSLSV